MLNKHSDPSSERTREASSIAKDGYEMGGVGQRAYDSVSASFLLKQFLKGLWFNREQRGRLSVLTELSV